MAINAVSDLDLHRIGTGSKKGIDFEAYFRALKEASIRERFLQKGGMVVAPSLG